MAECFCGCGRTVGFASRGLNKQGRRTTGLLAKLREARARIDRNESMENPAMVLAIATAMTEIDETDADSMARGIEKAFDEMIEDGENFEAFWIDAVHGDHLPSRDEARQIKGEWQRWGRIGMAGARAVGIPISRFGAFTGRV